MADSPSRRSFFNPFKTKSRIGSIASTTSSRNSNNDAKATDQKSVTVSRTRQVSVPFENETFIAERNARKAAKGIRSKSVPQNAYKPEVDITETYERDKQTGEIKDHTEMLHSLVLVDSCDVLLVEAQMRAAQALLQPGENVVAKLPKDLWMRAIEEASPADVASLALSCKAFRDLLGFEPWTNLNDPSNHRHRANFLIHMNERLPKHLFCFVCAKYHIRTQHGKETLRPTNISNPLFNCPNSTQIPPRIRLTFGRTLPFTFVQLAVRAHHHSSDHGITTDSLSRRYKDRDSTWQHQTMYVIKNGHLLMRVTSQCFATPGLPPSGERHLLYSREDFIPYFSVCAHWRNGVLMPSVKCAIRHIPIPPASSGLVGVGEKFHRKLKPPSPMVRLCENCEPIRRCPDCLSEYHIQIKMAEDRNDPVNLFKQALVVTRWSDLGDGSSPWSPEWASINGEGKVDSFAALGKRAVSGTFEAEFNGDLIPGHRIISLNPDNERLGEKGHNWY